MRPRCTFRVILYGKCGLAFDANAFDRLIIQVHVGDLDMLCLLHCFRINTKTMVLRRDLRATSTQILHRVIQSPVTMMHLEGRNVICQSEELVTETNAEHWLVFFQYLP